MQNGSRNKRLYIAARQCLQGVGKLKEAAESNSAILISSDVAVRDIEDVATRYKIWAGNIGALHQGSASLDARLKNAPEITEHVHRLLKDLSADLENLVLLIEGNIDQRVSLSSSNPFEDGQEDSDGSSVGSVHSSLAGDLPEIREVYVKFDMVKGDIESLYRSSMLIRKSTFLDPYSKVQPQADSPWYTRHSTERYPKLLRQPRLAENLGRALSKRRQYLQYREQHREKLNHGVDTAASTTMSQSTKPSAYVVDAKFNEIDLAEDDETDALSVTTYHTTADDTDESRKTLQVPSIPSEYGVPFECPYCKSITIAKDRQAWMRHVFRDLRPYICTFSECELCLFNTRSEWFEHELHSHFLRRKCVFCRSGPFDTRDLNTHLKKEHSSEFAESQLSAVVSNCPQQDLTFQADECPFCDTWTDSLRLKYAHLHKNGPTQRLDVSQKRYKKHVARHLEQLALFVLPRDEDEAEESMNKTNEDSSSSSRFSAVPSIPRGSPVQDTHSGYKHGQTSESRHHDNESLLRLSMKELLGIGSSQEAERNSAEVDPGFNLWVSNIDQQDVVAFISQYSGKADYTLERDERDRIVVKLRFLNWKDCEETKAWLERNKSSRFPISVSSVPPAPPAAMKLEDEEEDAEKDVEDDAETVSDKLPPIQFEDTIGRKFSFPWKICRKWDGMRELIEQAFRGIDGYEGYVQAGNYDLIGPDGEIILPQVWDSVVKPGTSITMQMWPFQNAEEEVQVEERSASLSALESIQNVDGFSYITPASYGSGLDASLRSKSQAKSILRRPTEKFPEDPNMVREGIAPSKETVKKGVPPNARWTKISRRLVDARALEEAGERFEERQDSIIILRPLSGEEINRLIERTREIKEKGYNVEQNKGERGNESYDTVDPPSPPYSPPSLHSSRTNPYRMRSGSARGDHEEQVRKSAEMVSQAPDYFARVGSNRNDNYVEEDDSRGRGRYYPVDPLPPRQREKSRDRQRASRIDLSQSRLGRRADDDDEDGVD